MVKCADCGYLAVRHYLSRQLLDAEELFRERGCIPSPGKGSVDLTYDEFPICFVRAIDFRKECGGTRPTEQQRSDVVNKPRDCARFIPWIQGFTPKEHYEMLQERDRLAWQEKRDQDARDFQSAQAKLADDRYGEQLRKADERHRENLNVAIKSARGNVWSTLIAGTVAALATLGAVWLTSLLSGHH